jgi:hypothetical protein
MISYIKMTTAWFEREWGNERAMHSLIKARERGTVGGR